MLLLIMCRTDNALVSSNLIANVSAGGISAGNYFNSFSESPIGSGLTLTNNTIHHAGLGHITAFGGGWGSGGGGIGIQGSYRLAPNATSLHTNITMAYNIITPLANQPAVSAQSVTGLRIGPGNLWCTWSAGGRNVVEHCADVTDDGNQCCDDACERCRPC